MHPVPVVGSQPGGGRLTYGAPIVLNSTPEEAVVSLATTVLLMKLTFNASCSETPPPSQPATLSAMMLLVTLTPYQLLELVEKRPTSAPLTSCRRRPPPVPDSAELPCSKFASITRPGP